MASLLSPPFVKKKVKRNKRRNARRFQREKCRQEKETQWESELDFQPSQPITFEPFIEGILPLIQGKFTSSSVQLRNWHFHQEIDRKRRNCI
jgi:hypothetical protein